MKKFVLSLIFMMLIGAAVMTLLYYLLASREDFVQALCTGLSFSALFPILWFYGFNNPSADQPVTPKQVKKVSLLALIILTIIVFAVCMTVAQWSLLKSLIYAIIIPVVGMGIGGIVFLIFRPDRNRPPVTRAD